jgi:hypothetical protein
LHPEIIACKLTTRSKVLMVSRRTLALPVLLFATALLVPSAHAQGRGGRGFGGAGARIGRRGLSGGAQRGGYYGGWGYLPDPYYYPDDESGYWPPAAPPYPPYQILMAPPAPPSPPVEPLLIEDRGGQWVRVPTGTQLPIATQGQPQTPTQTSSAPAASSAALPVAAQPIVKLPSAMIVFRDGHMEEVEKYVIRGNILYTSADYWTTGSWTRQIPVADLDVPATLKLNQQRGAKFDLPSSPSEIMVRF